MMLGFAIIALGGSIHAPGARAEAENVMLVLDASGSMWGQVDGKAKIVIARDVVGNVLDTLGDRVNMGVIAYGHRSKGDCKDIETVIPVGPVNAAAYKKAIDKIQPKGKTPITDAIRTAAKELRYREEKATVILVSDGLETCDADPCALAKELEAQGIDFTVHVVGFDLKKEDTASLQCLAESTGGRYLAADNADQLSEAVGQVVAEVKEPEPAPTPQAEPKPEPAVAPTLLKVTVHLTEDSPPLDDAYVFVVPAEAGKDTSKAAARGSSANPFKVAPGKYYLETKVGQSIGTAEVEVAADATTDAKIVLGAGLLTVKAVAEEGGKPIEEAYIRIFEPEAQADGKRVQVAAGNQRNTFKIPAGKYYVTATEGKASVGQEVEVAAGQKTDVVIVLASGLLKIDVLAEEGGKPLADAYINVYEPEAQADGKRKQITAGNQRNKFSIPAGQYYVTATVGKATAGQMVEVTAGKMMQTTIIVGVGALKATVIPAEGAKPLGDAYVTINTAEKNMDGTRTHVTAGNQRNTFQVPAGTYSVEAKVGKAVSEQDVEVKAGKLTEVTINLNAGSLAIKAESGTYVDVFKAEKNMDGSRDRIVSFAPRAPAILPAGSYVIVGKNKKRTGEVEATVTAGKLTEVTLELK